MKATKKTKKSARTPPDNNQCQAMKPNGNTFMTLGGIPGHVRCTSKPSVILTETKPAPDGLIGSMSLCADCLTVFNKQMPAGFATVEVIK